MFLAGTSQISSAHSGVQPAVCCTSLPNEVVPFTGPSASRSPSGPISTASTSNSPSSAACTPGVSKGTAAARAGSHTSGLRVTRSRRK
jgi:hypothetical protein